MKKLIITFEYPPQVGGIATYVHQFAKNLNIDEVVVLAPKNKGGREFDNQDGLRVWRKNMLWPIFIWPRWTKLIFQTWRIARKEKIEIIYLHHVLPVGYTSLILKKLFKIPYIVFSHGTDLIYASRSSWKKKMLTKVCVEAEQIILNSENLKKRFLKVLPQFENKAKVLYPCPEKVFLQEPDQKKIDKMKSQYGLEGKKVLLSVSRLDEGKGITHLVRMMPEILKKTPNLVWFVIGDGPKKDFLLSEIQKNNLQNVIRFVGEVKHEDLKDYYHLADLFVLLTHPDEGREEGLGMVFLEAAASGLPVVAGKSGGVEEAVLHTQTGVVVDLYKGDKNVISAVVEMLENKEYAQRLSENAKKRIESSFKWENQMKVIEKWL